MAIENLCATAFVCLAILGCGSSSSPDTVAVVATDHEGFEVVVGGESSDFSLATIRLCSEGFPEALRLMLTVTGPECPELSAQGPAGGTVSRGRVCEELFVQVRGFELGSAIPAQGSSAALVAYSRYEAPALYLSSGDGGSGSATGSITVRELRRMPDGRYRVGLDVALGGDADLKAAGVATARPTFCLGA